jgi:hypothetical protein
MNELSISKIGIRLARSTVNLLILFAAALAISSPTVTAQSADKPKTKAPADWPESAPYNAAIDAFDAALTRAAWDPEFRQRLIKSPDSAKEALAEVGDIKIPASKVIIFYEAQPARPDIAKSASAQDSAYTLVQLLSQSKSNENVHVFCLPPFKKNDKTKKYKYVEIFMWCYDDWWSKLQSRGLFLSSYVRRRALAPM